MNAYPLLDRIERPADLRQFERKDLVLAGRRTARLPARFRIEDWRASVVDLGTVELTIALHYVFNTPEDRIVWDVGHQTYGDRSSPPAAARRCPRCGCIDGIFRFPAPRRKRVRHLRHRALLDLISPHGMAIGAQRGGAARKAIAVISATAR